MKQLLSKEDVAKAIAELSAKGRKPTLVALHAALDHRGSMSTLVRLKSEIESAAQPVADSEEALKAFRQVWDLAFDEGRKQQEEVIAELRENLRVLATENERLDGIATGAERRAKELEQAKSAAQTELFQTRSKLEGELSRAQAALAQANAQAAKALESLAATQSAHSAEVGALQRKLADTIQKAHDQELRLVRAEATMEAKGCHA